jgi:L-ascorbate oxidase
MSRFWIALVIFSISFAPLSAQNPPAKRTTLRSHPRTFSQKVVTNKGLSLELQRKVLPDQIPLRYDVAGLKSDEHPSDEQLAQIINRMNALQAVVDQAKQPANSKSPSTDEIVQRLQVSLKNAKGVLKTDLENLLVACLVTVPRDGTDDAGKQYVYNTSVWSFRSLQGDDNWGPTIEMERDRVQLIPVLNLLDKVELVQKTVPCFDIVDPVRSGPDKDNILNGPNGFDVINLHTHGLNVSPNWPADNVFREIHPGQLKFYLYQIPPDQAAGTYFYHPHRHGSVATQVAGGMAGALIVRDPKSGLDQLGEANGWGCTSEKILMFQQLTLYKLDADSKDVFTRPDFFALKDVDIALGQICDRPDIQKIAKRIAGDVQHKILPISRLPAIETWVSGTFKPRLFKEPVAFGEIRRFRLIHAGVEENVNFTIQPTLPDLPAAMIQVIAWDGIPLLQPYFVSDRQQLTLSPGNRADVLVSVPAVPDKIFTEIAEYAIIQRGAEVKTDNYFATFEVDPSRQPPKSSSFVTIKQAKSVYDSCAPKLKHPEVPNLEAFDLAFADALIDATGAFTPGTFQINRKAFPDDRLTFRLEQSKNLAFAVVSGDSPHPLHIHVNPFHLRADPDRGALGLPTGEYWSDTLLIQAQTSVNVTMPFHRWTGEFVSHCHILDHEDAGMMNLIRVRPEVFSWPEFPVNPVMEMPNIPNSTLKSLKTDWPNVGEAVPAGVPKRVSLFVFMPSDSDGKACPHCTAAVQFISRLRKHLNPPESLRIVAISAAKAGASAKQQAEALGLLPGLDVLCFDPDLQAFETIALIDGTPVLKNGELRFPNAFLPGSRKPKQDSDVMHGLFITEENGMVVSARRAFSAFDDTHQIMREVQLAGKGRQSIVEAYKSGTISADPTEATGHLKVQSDRFEKRLKMFDAMKP